MEKIVRLQNTNDKLCKQLISLVDLSKGNNYEDTDIEVIISEDNIIVSTFCINEYGSVWDNRNHTRVDKSDIPFFTAKKLGII